MLSGHVNGDYLRLTFSDFWSLRVRVDRARSSRATRRRPAPYQTSPDHTRRPRPDRATTRSGTTPRARPGERGDLPAHADHRRHRDERGTAPDTGRAALLPHRARLGHQLVHPGVRGPVTARWPRRWP